VWNLPSASADLRAATEERDEVLAGADRAARRRETANQIASQLAAGTITLPVATDEVREVCHGADGMSFALGCVYKTAPTERHRFARHVIERAKRLLDTEPEQLAAVTARLEADYRAMLAPPKAPRAY
jgi:hypothetical protein